MPPPWGTALGPMLTTQAGQARQEKGHACADRPGPHPLGAQRRRPLPGAATLARVRILTAATPWSSRVVAQARAVAPVV